MAVIANICTQCSIYDILTVQLLKDTVLAGVDLTDDQDTPLPDVLFEQGIQAGVRTLESELGIQVEPFTFKKEQHDSVVGSDPFWFTQLNHRPIISVANLDLKYGTYVPVKIPDSWINVIRPTHGQLNIIPSQEGIGSFFTYRPGALVLAGWGTPGYPIMPGYFSYDYTAGFDCRCGQATIPDGENAVTVTFGTPILDDYDAVLTLSTANGAANPRVISRSNDDMTIAVTTPPAGGDAIIDFTVTTMPKNFVQAAAILAAMSPLDTAGDLILGAGIASKSISMDALQQTINSTSSPTNSGYGARMLSQRRQLKQHVSALKARYRVMQLGWV